VTQVQKNKWWQGSIEKEAIKFWLLEDNQKKYPNLYQFFLKSKHIRDVKDVAYRLETVK